MRVPKNAVTGSAPLRAARQFHRRKVRPLLREATVAGRRARGEAHGHLPDYLIVGVQKCGTTGLFDALTRADGFGTPLVKEIRYFDRDRLRPPEWYRAHFWSRDPRPLLWGEASPSYFDSPIVPARAARLVPSAKIVVQLRDPLARAISHYFHAVDFGFEARPIGDAFAAEVGLLQGAGWPTVEGLLHNGYLARGMYPVALRRWLDRFPREQVCVLVAERRAESLHAASQFLRGRSDTSSPAVAESNARRYSAPDDLDLRPAAELLRAACAELPALLGWDALPAEWELLHSTGR